MDNMKIEGTDFLTSKQVSKSLCITLRTVQRLSKAGKIKSIKVGNQWRYLKEDIEKYVSFGTDFTKEPARKPNAFIERRAYPRINCFLPCYTKVIIPQKKSASTMARILNISEGGIFIEDFYNDKQFLKIKTDDPIEVTFEIDKVTKIDMDGRGLRVEDKGIAVKFRKIKSEAKELIREYVG